jgi:PhnB protein
MSKIPEDFPTITPYLIIKNAAGFIQFTQDVFGAALINKHMRDENIIMHGEIKIGNSVIMFADSTAEYPPMNAGLFIYVEDADIAYKKALDNGAIAVTQLGNQSYGRSGGVKDAFGNTWWITSVI